MRAVVTGATGFCGKHLVEYLNNEGVEVYKLSLHQNGPESIVDRQQIMTQVFITIKPDFVFHLAGATNLADPIVVHQVNTLYAIMILNALECAQQKQTPVLFVGSAAEYGWVNREQLPVTEEFLGIPYSHYGISKLSQTFVGLKAARQGRRVVIVRPGNIVGPGMRDHLFLGNVIRQLREIMRSQRPPLVKIGNLDASRDFVDVLDVVEIYWKLIRTENAYGQVVNVCTGKAFTIDAVLRRLVALSGLAVELVAETRLLKNDDLPVYYGCTKKLRQLVGYVPTFCPEKSLKAMVNSIL